MTENNSADWDWRVYFDNVQNPHLRKTVAIALDVLGEGGGRMAVDLGCGAGNDTVHMVKGGYHVLSIDGSAEGIKRLKQRTDIPYDKVTAILSRYDHATWPRTVWLNAGYALPFCASDYFPVLFERIISNLVPGGIFSGHFFGAEDSWNGKVNDMTFHRAVEINDMIAPFKVHLFEEEKTAGTDATGRSKFWHVFHVVFQKESD